jgi:hypothetical protein
LASAIASDPARRADARVTNLLSWKFILPRMPAGETQNQEAKMRKLAIVLGASVTMLLAGGMAWKADAMT